MKKKNEYGHIIKGNTNIKNLWMSRDIVVVALNSLDIMLLGMELNQDRRAIEKIKNKLNRGLNKINYKLGIGIKSKLSQQNKNTTAKPITSPNRKQMGETGSADSLRGEELKDG